MFKEPIKCFNYLNPKDYFFITYHWSRVGVDCIECRCSFLGPQTPGKRDTKYM